MSTQDKIQDFHKWMLKIKNIHYCNNDLAEKAYIKILENKK